MIRQIWPGPERALGDDDLEQLYRYPADPRWLAVNFVSSVDGAVEIGGKSAGLSNPTDRVVYQLGSDLADVVLLGAGTATIEAFDGIHPDERTAERRRRHGLAPVPPIAVVTSGQSLPPDAPVLTGASVPTIVITSEQAPPALVAAWSAAGAEVLVAGREEVDLRLAIATLVERGFGRIDCEGGPRLFASLLEAGLVDEVRLTLSPLLVAGTADRIAVGADFLPAGAALASVLTDGATLLLRYFPSPDERNA
ncbi:pyrimidine reductase family protein [Amycolatopsis sp. NPDC059021]|uniref:pyrimidine reductase family protein n=1 Tax=Amycolatopsis sp. NPDC059021 TaxID=3346704 RepID=UPI00367231AD